MNISSAQLLKLLSSGVGSPHTTAATAPVGTAAFADLLKQAQDGGLMSRVPVTVDGDAEASGLQVDEQQLARIGLAADKLEASGVRNALISIDGKQLVLDVHARRITGVANVQNGIVSGIDGMMDLGDARPQDAVALADAQKALTGAGTALGGLRRLPLPSAAVGANLSISKLLAGISGAAGG